jgi:hypothetical protein
MTYDSLLRPSVYTTTNGSSTTIAAAQYGYDGASRLQTVTSGVDTSVYSYLANSSLLGNVQFSHSGTTVMTTSKTYDYLNRLTSISNLTSTVTDARSYGYNAANQRVGTLHGCWGRGRTGWPWRRRSEIGDDISISLTP